MESGDHILENSTRSQIQSRIIRDPGITFHDLMSSLDIKEGTLRYHLDYMQKHSVIRSEDHNGRKRYYSFYDQKASTLSENDPLSPFQKKLVSSIQDHPGINQKELCMKMRRNRYLISYHLKRIMSMGLIRSEKKGKNILYYHLDREELKKMMLLELVDDLLMKKLDEESFLDLKSKIEQI